MFFIREKKQENPYRKKDFIDAVATASEKQSIREVYIEKDYWVTYVLKNLSSCKYANKVVFKGGTKNVGRSHSREKDSQNNPQYHFGNLNLILFT